MFDKERIRRIVEKPKRLLSRFIASTPCVFEPRIFSYFKYGRPTAAGEYHLATILQYLINKGEEIRFMMLDIWRININTFKDIKKAEKLIARSQGLWG